MRAYIKKLNDKPEIVRKQMLTLAMVLCMMIVGSVWMYSLGGRFNAEAIEKTKEDVKPFALFGSSLKSEYSNITASAGSAQPVSDQPVATHQNDTMIPVIPVYQ